MPPLPDPHAHRTADHPVDLIFLERWSPRAMSGESLTDDEIGSLFEAARWAPSTYNVQEWRFSYATRDSAHWDRFLSLLVEFNQGWAKQAGLLGVVMSDSLFPRNGKPNPVHVFDSGMAYVSLALQGARMGLVVHGMAGFDADAARQALNVPERYSINAMFAVGRPGDTSVLPEAIRDQEIPSGRKPVHEIAREGMFDFPD